MTKNRARRTSLIGGRLLHAFHHGDPGLSGNGYIGAGWSSPVARQAHNLKVVGSNPTPATKLKARHVKALAGFFARKIARFLSILLNAWSASKINDMSCCVIV